MGPLDRGHTICIASYAGTSELRLFLLRPLLEVPLYVLSFMHYLDSTTNIALLLGDPHMESPMGKLDPLEAIFNEDDQRIEGIRISC